jgi:tripartite-type tricarboxylate transporter receptor subunit TctC
MAARVDVGMDNIPSALAFIKDGKLRALATTGATRSAVLPDVPTMDEAGAKGFEATAWFGVLAPAATPKPIIARMGQELDAVARDPAFRARMAALGGELPALTPNGGTAPEPFEQFLAAERVKWAEVVRRSGARVE